MKAYTYNGEFKDLLTQFVAAFDDVTIKRYNNQKEPQEEIQVRYVLAPKQRVMYDIVNKAQNLTLPVVAVNITTIERDNNRVFNKLNNLYTYTSEIDSAEVKMPVPINITVSMSILARYMEDMDQILSNFIPYSNPYVILSWKEPSNITNEVFEIRSEVLWNGSITMTSPIDTTFNDKIRITADTSFVIKGWIFKNKNEIAAPIYFIETNFTQLSGSSLNIYSDTNLDTLSSTDTDTFRISAYPGMTNLWHNYQSNLQPIRSAYSIKASLTGSNTYLVYGSNYDYTTRVLLSSNNTSLYNNLTSVSTARMGVVSGFSVPNYTILTDNILSLSIPYTANAGKIDIVIVNPAGFALTSAISGVSLQLN